MSEPTPEASGFVKESFGHHRELHDAREQSVASHEILVALGRAGANPAEILDTIVARAARLCRAQAAQISLVEGQMFRLSRVSGDVSEEYRRYLREHPVSMNRSSLLGRVAQDRSTQQIADVLSDPDYGRQDLQRLVGFRTLMSAPMILDDVVVGVLTVWRTDLAPFDDQERDLLSAFAVQAAIVIRQVDLFRTLESRSAELASKVAQLEALREVGDAVNSSLDPDEVLRQIVTNAVQLTGADGSSIMEYSEDGSFAVRTAYGSGSELLSRLRATTIRLESTMVGRAALERRPIEVADLTSAQLDPHLQVLYDDGWRSVLAVPILRADRIVGALVVRRRTTGGFPPDIVDLVETLASQSAVAIVNARLFRELELKSAEVEVVSQHKSEFLANMSHELRTPLNAVIGFSEVLLDRLFGDLNERQEEYLHDIRNSGRHLLELLNDILDLSKVEAGQMALESTTFDVAAAIDHTVSLVRERAVAGSLTVTLEVREGLEAVDADELRFKQVVLNLVSNAVKFTPANGHVSVRAWQDHGELLVTVTDTGIGVAVEDRERIFESFQQGGRETTEEGTGLGLTLSRRIVELFGGRMWLDSQVGRGSTFGFAIPNAAPVQYDSTGTRITSRITDTAPVLVAVDDDRASLDLLTAYLSGTGLQVLRAGDGDEALRLVRKLHPAVVLLDIGLPGQDGWTVLSALKADPDTTEIPVIITTIVDERSKGLSLGAADYLVKPFGREAVLEALRRAAVPAELGPGR